MRRTWRWGTGAAVAAALTLVAAGVAVGAAAGSYSGKTSQNESVSFRLGSGSVSNFKIAIKDKCPDGHTLRVTGHYPSMTVRGGKFGGKFVPVGGHSGEKATLSGKVGGTKVTGTLTDTSFSSREGRLCHGSAKFSAKHR
jgi:hypothetical protein